MEEPNPYGEPPPLGRFCAPTSGISLTLHTLWALAIARPFSTDLVDPCGFSAGVGRGDAGRPAFRPTEG
jgi:hypothetical protein